MATKITTPDLVRECLELLGVEKDLSNVRKVEIILESQEPVILKVEEIVEVE